MIVTIWSSDGATNATGCIDWLSGIMKLRIVKNFRKVIEKMEEGEILVAKNFKTLDEKGHFIAEEVNVQEEF